MELVGRDAAVATLGRALDDAVAGRGRLVLLTGEPGIGKTALARELAARAAAAGAAVRWAAAWEGEGERAHGIWLQLADAAEPLHGVRDALTADPDADRAVAFDRVATELGRAGAARPQVLVLDDLHWADGASLRLLAHLAGRLPGMAVLAVGTFRDAEVDPGSPLAALGGSIERLPLPGLAADSVAAVLADALGRPAEQPLVDEIARRTLGNPFFVTQLGRLLASGPGGELASTPLPAGVRDVLAHRLARLPNHTYRLLTVAAVVGQAFDAAVLADAAGEPLGAVLDALGAAEAARVVTHGRSSTTGFAFVHVLFQQTLVEGLGPGERARLHRQVAEALELRPGAPAAELARHHLAARLDADDDRAARWSIRAGDEALARLAWEEATEHFRRALDATPDVAIRGEASVGLGASLLRAGRADEAAHAFIAAADAADGVGDPSLLARAALGFGAGLGGFEVPMLDRRQVELLERALAALPPGDRHRPLVLARLSVATSFLDTPARRLELAEQAVEEARASGDAQGLVAALAAHCDALAGPADVDVRLGESTEIIATATGVGDRRLELLGRRLRLVALLELGRFAEADAEAAAFARSAEELGDPLYSWYVPLWRGMAALRDGRLDDATVCADEAAAIGARVGSDNAEVLSWVLRVAVRADRHDETLVDDIAGYTAERRDLLGPGVELSTAGELAEMAMGARVAAFLARVDGIDGLPVDAEWVGCAANFVAGATSAGGHPGLVAAVEAMLPFEAVAVVEGIGARVRGSVGRFVAPALVVLGRDDEAVAMAERAAERDVAAGRLPAAHARRVLASVLHGVGAGERAAVESRAAIALYRDIGLHGVAERWSALLGVGTAPAPAPEAAAAPVGEAALVREGDTWAVTFGGTTVRVRHVKGVADLAVLLARPAAAVHVRELEPGAPPSTGAEDPRLDRTAIEAYKARVLELEVDLDEADAMGDAGRSERLRSERDFLVDELAAALGLGGRSRPQAGDPDERLRKAVSARVRDAIRRVEEHHDRLGRHLRNSVKTGFWCSYEPEDAVVWRVEP